MDGLRLQAELIRFTPGSLTAGAKLLNLKSPVKAHSLYPESEELSHT